MADVPLIRNEGLDKAVKAQISKNDKRFLKATIILSMVSGKTEIRNKLTKLLLKYFMSFGQKTRKPATIFLSFSPRQ